MKRRPLTYRLMLLASGLLSSLSAWAFSPNGTFTAEDFARYHFVLVGGYTNEFHPAYYAAFEKFLRDHGATAVTRVMPSSMQSVKENIPFCDAQFLRAHERGGKPLFILAHSKGSLETANTIFSHPDHFPPEVVAKIVLANGPFNGSPQTVRSIEEFKAMWSWNPLNPFYQPSLNALESMRTETIAHDLNESAKHVSHAELASISDRTFFLRTDIPADQINPALKNFATYLEQFGPNDGLIPAENQKLGAFGGLAQFGHDLPVVHGVDHNELFLREHVLDRNLSERYQNLLDHVAAAGTTPPVAAIVPCATHFSELRK